MTTAKTRRYDSTLRQELAARTRRTVLDVASRLFIERGWDGTSMRDIAKEAGCSVETIYSSVGNKPTLLKEVLDIAVVGDDADIPLADRPWAHVDTTAPLAERIAAGVDAGAAIYQRTAPLRRVLDIAAQGNAELAVLEAKSRQDEHVSRTALVGEAAGRPLTDVEAVGLQSVFSNEIYLVLSERSGWTHEQYKSWAAHAVVRLLDLHEEQQP